MEIVFAGICCWVDALPPNTGKTVIIPNATRGGSHRGNPIPPHSAFVHAKQNQVESSDWQPAVTSDDNLVFLLDGDSITFDPVPSGGSIDVSDLPHVKARITNSPICAAADELRPGFLDDPSPVNVAGLVNLPPDATVSTSGNGTGARFATLHMPDGPVTITATSFSGTASRSLKITDPSATVFIANVTMRDYLLRIPAADDDHQFLVCEMFTPQSMPNRMPPTDRSHTPTMTAELSAPRMNPLDVKELSELKGTSVEIMHDFLCGFAAGCSNSVWP